MVSVESGSRVAAADIPQHSAEIYLGNGDIAVIGAEVVIEPVPEPLGVPETNTFDANRKFSDIAESIRPICGQLDDAWRETDSIKHVAVDKMREVVEVTITEQVQPLISSNNRKVRKALGVMRSDRGPQIIVEGMSMIIRNGVVESIGSGVYTEPRDYYRYREAHGVAGKYIESYKSPHLPISDEAYAEGRSSINGIMDDLTCSLAERYERIYQCGLPLLASTADYISKGIEQAQSFIDWVEAADEEQDGDYRAYLQMLSADLQDKDGQGLLESALQQLKSNTNGDLRRDFIDSIRQGESVAESETGQWLALVKKSAAKAGEELDEDEFRDLMIGLNAHWPDSLKAAYASYTDHYLKNMRDGLESLLGKYAAKTRLNVSRQLVDTLLLTDEKRHDKERAGSYSSSKRRSIGKTGRTTPSAKKVIPTREDEPDSVTTLSVLKQTPEGFCAEQDDAEVSVERMIERYCSAHPENGLDETLTRLVEHIKTDPYGPGTKKMTDVFVKVDGRPYPLRRATVRRNVELGSSGNTAYRTRVIYAVLPAEDKGDFVVAIREVLHHNEVDQKYT